MSVRERTRRALAVAAPLCSEKAPRSTDGASSPSASCTSSAMRCTESGSTRLQHRERLVNAAFAQRSERQL